MSFISLVFSAGAVASSFIYNHQISLTKNELANTQAEQKAKLEKMNEVVLSNPLLKSAGVNESVKLTLKLSDGSIAYGSLLESEISEGDLGGETTVVEPSGKVSEVEASDGTVSNLEIKDGSVSIAKIIDGAVTTAKLADGSVTEIKILNGVVTGGKIASGTITASHLASGSIFSAHVSDGVITESKIADGAVSNQKIANLSITAAKIALGTITGSQIASDGSVVKSIVGSSLITVTDNSNGSFSLSFADACLNDQILKVVDSSWACIDATSVGLTIEDHGEINHSGLSGIPSIAGLLDETAHDLIDHSGLSGIPSITGLIDESAHDLLDHTGLAGIPTTAGLLDETAHDTLDHSGLTGINNFDAAAHALVDHSSLVVAGDEQWKAPVADESSLPINTETLLYSQLLENNSSGQSEDRFQTVSNLVGDHFLGAGEGDYKFKFSVDLGTGTLFLTADIYSNSAANKPGELLYNCGYSVEVLSDSKVDFAFTGANLIQDTKYWVVVHKTSGTTTSSSLKFSSVTGHQFWYSANAGATWISAYGSNYALYLMVYSTTTNSYEGDMRVAKDTGNLFFFNGLSWDQIGDDAALLLGRSGGQIIIGGTAADETLTFKANSASSGNTLTADGIIMKVGDSGEATAITIKNDGRVYFNSLGTLSGQADVQYDTSTKELGYVSSSIRYKENVRDVGDLDWLYDLDVVEYNYKDDVEKEVQIGLIAEQVEKINSGLIAYNELGQPETVSYTSLIAPILKIIQGQRESLVGFSSILSEQGIKFQEMSAELTELKNRISNQEERLDNLEKELESLESRL